jgi:hypothetical protein
VETAPARDLDALENAAEAIGAILSGR